MTTMMFTNYSGPIIQENGGQQVHTIIEIMIIKAIMDYDPEKPNLTLPVIEW
jgi:hypothetical protein